MVSCSNLRYYTYFACMSGCEVLWWVCLSVCLSVREDISATTRAIFAKFLCMLPMSVARSSSSTLTIGHIAYCREGGRECTARAKCTTTAFFISVFNFSFFSESTLSDVCQLNFWKRFHMMWLGVLYVRYRKNNLRVRYAYVKIQLQSSKNFLVSSTMHRACAVACGLLVVLLWPLVILL